MRETEPTSMFPDVPTTTSLDDLLSSVNIRIRVDAGILNEKEDQYCDPLEDYLPEKVFQSFHSRISSVRDMDVLRDVRNNLDSLLKDVQTRNTFDPLSETAGVGIVLTEIGRIRENLAIAQAATSFPH